MTTDESTMGSALDVAALIIEKVPGLDQVSLHKFLYLTQAAQLSWFDEPAFPEAIEAWKYGPVTRRVAGHYLRFGSDPIAEPVSGDSSRVVERTRWVVEKVLADYGDLSGFQVAALVKEDPDAPWHQVRGDLSPTADCDEEIPTDLISSYHRLHGMPRTSTPNPEENALAQRFFSGDEEAFDDLAELVLGSRPSRS